ncbi:MAG: cyclic nucleotide-binding domain-containing protein [Thermoanaerobaculia bacterium]
MLTAWTIPLLYGMGTLVALEAAYLVLRRVLPGFRLRLIYQLWAVGVAVLAALTVAHVDRQIGGWKAAAATTAVLSAWVAFALVNAAVIKRPWRPDAPFLPKLARDVLRMGVLIAVGLLAAKTILGVELGAILVSSTVLSAVAGLALQDVLKNVFAGLALDVEKPFARGDWLMLDGQTAVQVVDMSWRTTRLRTKEGVDIYEPNARISNDRLLNYGSGQRPIALAFRVGLPYGAPPADVKQAIRAAAHSVPGTLAEPPVAVFLESFADHAITYYVRVWTRSVADIGRFRDAINSRIWYELKRRDLSIPFPVRTVHLHSAPAMENAARRDEHARAVARLSRLELFRELDPDAVRTLAEGATRRHYDDGEVLVREGDAGESLLVIDAGSAVASKSTEGGGGVEIDVGRLDEGDFLGEQSLLTGEPRNATVRADGGCVVLEIAKPQLAEILTADPKIAEVLSHVLVTRQELTDASLASHQEQQRSRSQVASEASILARMRAFFGLR